MLVYSKWKFSLATSNDIPMPYYEVEDAEGVDWYELMVQLDGRSERYVVGTDSGGRVTWFTTGKVSGRYAPFEGGDVIVTDNFPADARHGTVCWDGREFHVEQQEDTSRTKADIENDLKRLLAELEGVSE